MRILGLDPGTRVTGVVVFDSEEGHDGQVLFADGAMDNALVLQMMERGGLPYEPSRVVIETMSPRGMNLGRDTFDAIFFAGRLYQQAAAQVRNLCLDGVNPVERDTIKRVLLGRTNLPGADSKLRQLLLDEVGPKGTKRAPGPTYGVSKHAWQALAAVWAFLYILREGANEQ